MKKNIFFLCCLFFSSATIFGEKNKVESGEVQYHVFDALVDKLSQVHISEKKEHDPLLVVVLMVKNEEQVIIPTLQPYIDAGVHSFLIYDTGSTDKTMAITREHFDKSGVKNGAIVQDPFIDFATSRNRALKTAEKIFPNACFMLMPDAEWYMHNVEGLLDFCKQQEQNLAGFNYLVRIMNPSVDFYTPRLIRCHAPVEFVGVVHEVVNYGTRDKVPSDVYFEWRTTRYGREKTQQRWTRDRDLLLKELEKHPDDPRTVFYLGQTYACLGDWENAYTTYKKRTQLQGWDEENFVAWCRFALCCEAIGKWDEALCANIKAYSYRPKRIESLARLAQHYWDAGDHALCYLFSRRAAEVPYPKDDVLFVEKEVYDFVRYDLLSRTAWYVGEYEIGEEAMHKALEARPNEPYLHKNLEWYTNRKKEAEKAKMVEPALSNVSNEALFALTGAL